MYTREIELLETFLARANPSAAASAMDEESASASLRKSKSKMKREVTPKVRLERGGGGAEKQHIMYGTPQFEGGRAALDEEPASVFPQTQAPS